MDENELTQISKESEDRIRLKISEHSLLSSRNSAFEIGIHHTTIRRFLREELKLFLYKIQIHQQINDEHKDSRIDFVYFHCRELGIDSGFLKGIVFSGERKFSLS